MKKIILIAMVLIATVNTKAQEKIKGRVVEKLENGTESPIIGANVYWEGTTIGVASDKDGYYLIPAPEQYPATLVVSFVGYQHYSEKIKKWGHYHVVLVPSVELQEVKVQGKVNTTQISTIQTLNTQTLSTGELEKAACCNLSESFSTNATVDVTFTDAVSGAKQIQMLGLDGIYTQITQENVPLIRGISSVYGLNYVPGTWIESIQIIKGAGSVVNGFESLAGQINLEYFKPETAPKFYYNLYVNQEGKFENNLQLANKKGNWQSNLFTHFSYFGKEVDRCGETGENGGDGFMDMPKTTQFNTLNRWEYTGNEKYHIAFIGRMLVEDRIGGSISEVPQAIRYIVDIHNDLIEFSTKTGFISPVPGKSIGLQTSVRRHGQKAIFGKNNYSGLQESIYANLIRQTFVNNTNHKLKYGMSYYADRFSEELIGNIASPYNKIRVDLVTGIFTEYTYKRGENLNLTLGLRSDYYNRTNQFNTLPRMNLKYNPTDKTVMRISAGRALRIANPIVENSSFLASDRQIDIKDLSPELGWNFGANYVYSFYLFNREGSVNLDAYRTVFENQVMVDIETQNQLTFYNLDGKSFANSYQFDFSYELLKNFDIKMSYKENDVQATYQGEQKLVPLTPKNRALLNLAYATNFDKWKFDFTINYFGQSRIPENQYHIYGEQLGEDNMTSPFYLYSAQVTKKFKNFDMYIGGENLSDYLQNYPIIKVENNFDAAMIWAPVAGRMTYLGIRYKLK